MLKKTRKRFPTLILFFSISVFINAQNMVTTEKVFEQKSAETELIPMAIPILSQAEAQKTNKEATKQYDLLSKGFKKQKQWLFIERCTLVIMFLFLGSAIAYLIKKKRAKSALLRFYGSQFGRMFYCTRFNRWDWAAILLISLITFFFSMLAGQKAMLNGYIGNWYAESFGTRAIARYNTGEDIGVVPKPESALEYFLKKGSTGDLDYSSLKNEDAVPQEYHSPTNFLSPGITWLIAKWWKIIGYPDWSTLYILFSLFYCLVVTAAYFAFRQITGLIPSTILALLLSSYPSMMNQVIFGFRDGARALFCFIAIAILIYQLKGAFNWKGTTVCSIFLFAICSLSSMFRNDFIVFIPFIVIAVIFFHGKIYSGYKKKLIMISSIIIGLVIASEVSMTKKYNIYGFGHVLYIGMADHPFMDDLYFSADNYTKGIVCSDQYGYIFASAKAWREQNKLNIPHYSKEYDQICKKEIQNLVCLYPYDYLRLALSAFIQSAHIGSKYAERKLKWIENAPGYWLYQGRAKEFYQNIPSWFYLIPLGGTLLLLLGGRFYANIIVCLAFMAMSSVYLFQYDLRHYFFLLIVSFLTSGFVTNRLFRLVFLLARSTRKVYTLIIFKKMIFVRHCIVLAGLFLIASFILIGTKQIQKIQINKELNCFSAAQIETVSFKKNTVPSKIHKGISATEVLFPDYYNSFLERENARQNDFMDFLRVQFKVIDAEEKQKVDIFAKYENTAQLDSIPLRMGYIINNTRTCPIRLSFTACSEINTLYMPVYFTRDSSPLIGIELCANGKPIEISSVERVVDPQKVRTQSAFLIPTHINEMTYSGIVDWEKIFINYKY